MRSISLALLVALVLPLAACDSGEDSESDATPLPVNSVSGVTYDGERATFGVYLRLPDGCTAPAREEVERDGAEVEVRIYGERRIAEPCPDLAPGDFYSQVVVALEPGTYTVRFWKAEGETVDMTVTLE